jgi:hypothetical protein
MGTSLGTLERVWELIWEHGNMETWKHGNMETWEHAWELLWEQFACLGHCCWDRAWIHGNDSDDSLHKVSHGYGNNELIG